MYPLDEEPSGHVKLNAFDGRLRPIQYCLDRGVEWVGDVKLGVEGVGVLPDDVARQK